MLSLARSRSTIPVKCHHRTTLGSFHGAAARINDTSSFIGNGLLKDVLIAPEASSLNSVTSPSEIHPQDHSLSTEALVDITTIPADIFPAAAGSDKPKKKNKNKNKKKSEKSVSPVDCRSEAPSNDGETGESSHASQYGVVPDDNSQCSLNRRSKKGRGGVGESQVKLSEHVAGYCGSLPVDDLIEFIDHGRKRLNRIKSQSLLDDANGSLTGNTSSKSRTSKQLTGSSFSPQTKDMMAESDSGYGDVDGPDRGIDAGPYDCPSPLSSTNSTESVEVIVDTNSDGATVNINGLSLLESREELGTRGELAVSDSLEASVTSESSPTYWSADSELAFDCSAFMSDDDISKKSQHEEEEFILVQQKKRRSKPLVSLAALSTGAATSQNIAPRNAQVNIVVQNGSSSFVQSCSKSSRSSSPLEHLSDPRPKPVVSTRFRHDTSFHKMTGSTDRGCFAAARRPFSRNFVNGGGLENRRFNGRRGGGTLPPRLCRSSSANLPSASVARNSLSITSQDNVGYGDCGIKLCAGCSLPDVIPTSSTKNNSSGGVIIFLDENGQKLQEVDRGTLGVVVGCDSVRPDVADAHCQTTADDFAAATASAICKSSSVASVQSASLASSLIIDANDVDAVTQQFDLLSCQKFLFREFEGVMLSAAKSRPSDVQFYSSEQPPTNTGRLLSSSLSVPNH